MNGPVDLDCRAQVHTPARCPDAEQLASQFGCEGRDEQRRRGQSSRNASAPVTAAALPIGKQGAGNDGFDDLFPGVWVVFSNGAHGRASEDPGSNPAKASRVPGMAERGFPSGRQPEMLVTKSSSL